MVSPTTAPTPDTGPDTSQTPRVAADAPTPGALTIFLPHAPHSSFPPASLPSHQGNGSTKLDKALLADTDGERYYGLENFGNTCYANSVLQALYFCKPFRHAILEYHESLPKDHDESLRTDTRSTAMTAGAKLAGVPLLFVLGGIAFGFRGMELGILLLMAAAPSAAASYVMVRAMGGNAPLAANIVALTTIGSILATSLGLTVLRAYALI